MPKRNNSDPWDRMRVNRGRYARGKAQHSAAGGGRRRKMYKAAENATKMSGMQEPTNAKSPWADRSYRKKMVRFSSADQYRRRGGN